MKKIFYLYESKRNYGSYIIKDKEQDINEYGFVIIQSDEPETIESFVGELIVNGGYSSDKLDWLEMLHNDISECDATESDLY